MMPKSILVVMCFFLISAQSFAEYTPLMKAVLGADVDAATKLLGKKKVEVQVDAVEADAGVTPLYQAVLIAIRGSLSAPIIGQIARIDFGIRSRQIVALLMLNGANPAWRSDAFFTPLSLAKRSRRRDLVAIMTDRNAAIEALPQLAAALPSEAVASESHSSPTGTSDTSTFYDGVHFVILVIFGFFNFGQQASSIG